MRKMCKIPADLSKYRRRQESFLFNLRGECLCQWAKEATQGTPVKLNTSASKFRSADASSRVLLEIPFAAADRGT